MAMMPHDLDWPMILDHYIRTAARREKRLLEAKQKATEAYQRRQRDATVVRLNNTIRIQGAVIASLRTTVRDMTLALKGEALPEQTGLHLIESEG